MMTNLNPMQFGTGQPMSAMSGLTSTSPMGRPSMTASASVPATSFPKMATG